jgi:predicted PurR-regulated permease PerM
MNKKNVWIIATLSFLAFLLAACWLLYDSLLPLFIAFGMAYAFNPLVDALHKRGVARSLAAIALLIVVIGSLVLLLIHVIPLLIEQIHDFAQHFPDFVSTALQRLSSVADRYGIGLPVERDALIEKLRERVNRMSMTGLSPVLAATGHMIAGAGSVILSILNIFIVPVFFFYFLRDFPSMRRTVLGLVPPRHQALARSFYRRFDAVLSGYIRGQLLVALILGCVFAIGLFAIGIKFGVVIGLAAGLLNVIPYVGQATGLVLSLIMALVDYRGAGPLIAVPILFGVANFLEGNFITPRIVGNKVGLTPIWSIISLIVGGELAGFGGILVAIPVAGCIRVVLLDLTERYRRSELYRSPTDTPSAKKN